MSSLTEGVRRAAREAGADLVGFAPVSRFDNAPPLLHPRTIFPQTRTVIAVAVRHERGALKAVEEGTYWQAYNCDNYWYLFNRFVKHRFRHCGICVGRGCLRACLDHLEKKGRLKFKYRTPMIERERWKLDEPPAGGGSA